MKNLDEIKTIKYIKRTKYISLLYFVFCFISIMLFLIHDYQYATYNNRELFDIATLTVYLWLVNPMVLIVSSIGFINYLIERKDNRKREQIGRKWVTFLLWDVSTAMAWFVSGICFVYITGGV